MRIRKEQRIFSPETEIIAKASDALAHPLRVEMFQYIYKENMDRRKPCTKNLVEQFGYSQSTISQHMNALTSSGLVEVIKEKSFSYYYVNIGMLGKYLDAVKRINQ